MMKKDDYLKSLTASLSTISNCDNKATSLLTAVGIVFGFSMFSTQELLNKCGIIKLLIIIFGIGYLSVFIATIVLLVLIIFPRRRTMKQRKNAIDYACYPEDLYKHYKANDLEAFLDSNSDNEKAILDQIRNCSRIAHIKETLLRIVAFLIIAFACLLVSLIVCLFI